MVITSDQKNPDDKDGESDVKTWIAAGCQTILPSDKKMIKGRIMLWVIS